MLREIAADDSALLAALTQAGLPTDDLTSEPFHYFGWQSVAFGGIGVGADALIRSVVVAQRARGQGHGAAMVTCLADAAQERGVKRLWLLATDATQFFERLNWRVAERGDAPAAIAKSRQFSGLCPTSASLMVRML